MIKKIDIKGLQFPENVRTRPTMYLGGLENSTQLVKEIVSNGLDEALSPYSSCNKVVLQGLEEKKYQLNNKEYKTKGYLILDNGRGLPLAQVKNEKDEMITMARYSLESLHTSSKFMNEVSSIGSHGVGSSCCSAVSYIYEVFIKLGKTAREEESPSNVKKMIKETKGNIYHIQYKYGLLEKEEVILNEEIENKFYSLLPDWSTAVIFYPDLSIMESYKAYYENESRYTKYLIDRLGKNFQLIVNGKEFEFTFKPYKYKIENKVRTTMEDKETYLEYIISLEDTTEEEGRYEEYITGSVNGLQVDSKYHTNLVKEVFKEVFYKQFGNCHGKERLGLKFDVIFMCPEPQFDSQTKTRLVNLPYVDYDTLYQSIYKDLTNLIKLNTEFFLEHYNHILQYLDSINNLSSIQKIESHAPQSDQGKTYKARLSQTNVKDCLSTNVEERELFIVEGGSAGSTVVQSRDRKTQAVLPLRGKVLNAALLLPEDMIENKEISDFITCVGAGIDSNVKLENLRYNRIIIACFDKNMIPNLANGERKTFLELYNELGEGGEVEVYTLNKNNELDTEIATIHKTKVVDKMVRIKFADNSWIRCTEDHLIKVNGKGWVEAKDLQVGDSICSMKMKEYKGYHYYITSHMSEFEFVHRRIGGLLNLSKEERNLNDFNNSIITHHKNGNKLDNRKCNLELIKQIEHASNHGTERFKSDKHRQYMREEMKIGTESREKRLVGFERWRNSEECKELCRQNMKKFFSDLIRIKQKYDKTWGNKEWKKSHLQFRYVRDAMRKVINNLEYNLFYHLNDVLDNMSDNIKSKYYESKDDIIDVLLKLSLDDEFKDYKWMINNHIVKAVIYDETPNEQTYCLHVPKNHNFFVYDNKKEITKRGIEYENFINCHNCDEDCVLPDTIIKNNKTIEELYNSNERIISIETLNTETNKVEIQEGEIIKGSKIIEYVRLLLSDMTGICGSIDHKVYDENNNKIKLIDTNVGDLITVRDGTNRILEKHVITCEEEIQTYSIIGLKNGNFFLPNKILSSNCDGLNIRAIILGIIAEHMSYLIDNGHVYIAMTPLFEQDNEPIYAHEKEKLNRKKPFSRFKG